MPCLHLNHVYFEVSPPHVTFLVAVNRQLPLTPPFFCPARKEMRLLFLGADGFNLSDPSRKKNPRVISKLLIIYIYSINIINIIIITIIYILYILYCIILYNNIYICVCVCLLIYTYILCFFHHLPKMKPLESPTAGLEVVQASRTQQAFQIRQQLLQFGLLFWGAPMTLTGITSYPLTTVGVSYIFSIQAPT